MTAIDGLARLRLDIERDPGVDEPVNLIQNPSGELGGWGWITPVAGSAMSGGAELAYAGVASVANWFTSELAPVTAGQYVAASWTNPFHTNSGLVRARLVWYDANAAVVSSGAQGAYQTAAGDYAIAATVVPTGVTQVALRFDLYSTTAGANPTSTTRSLWLQGATMATAATAAKLLQIRRNLVLNPSFEVDATNWTTSAATLARTTTQASVGSACGQVTPAPAMATNLCPNPSFETNTTGWAAGSDTASVARGSGGYSSSFSCVATTVSVPPGASGTSYVNSPQMTGVVAGATHYFTFAIYQDPAAALGTSVTGSSRGVVRWYNSSGVQIGSDVAISSASFGNRTWLVRSFSLVAPAGAARVAVFPSLSWTNNYFQTVWTEFRIDQMCVSTVPGYFDGDSADTGAYQYDWTGAANASTSTRTTFVASAAIVTTALAVTDGVTYAASAAFRAASTVRTASIAFEWRNGSGAVISTVMATPGADSASSWTRYGATAVAPSGAATLLVSFGAVINAFAATDVHYVDAVLVEAAASVGAYFDGATADTVDWDYAWTGTANASASTATSTTNNLVDLPPAYYVDVIGESANLTVERQELNLSTLTGTVVSTSLDPAQSTLLRPGRQVRLLVDTTGSGGWEELFTGETQKASVEYRLLNPDEEKRAIISIAAVDALTRLAQEPRPDGVGTIAELPYVLEGCGVPWSVNGSGNQVPNATVVANNDQATAVDQVAVTRDSNAGFAWVDRKGILQAWDAAQISTTVAAVLDEDAYTADFGVSYATDRVVNIVQIDSYEVNPATGGTGLVSPKSIYRDEDSVRQWGAWQKPFTVQGKTDAEIDALGAAILAANKTPTRIVDYVVLPLTAETIGRALLDLYDLVTVANTRAALNDDLRIVGVTHTISASNVGTKWLMKLDFAGDGTAAPPQLIPKPSADSGASSVDRLTGTVTVALSAASQGSVALTFPAGSFASTPKVVATVNAATFGYFAVVTAKSATGCTIGVSQRDGTAATGSVVVDWVAFAG